MLQLFMNNRLLLSFSVALVSIVGLAGASVGQTLEDLVIDQDADQEHLSVINELPSKATFSTGSTTSADLLLSDSTGVDATSADPAAPDPETSESTPAEGTEPARIETGTDPSKLIRRLEFNLQYIDAPNGGFTIAPVMRFDNPLTRSAAVALEVPLSYTKVGIPTATGGTNYLDAFGLGDTFVRGRYVWNFDAVSLVAGLEFGLPTATDTLLGTGKWQVGPTVAMVYRFSSEVLGAVAYKHRFSIAGDSNRADISTGEPRLILAYTSRQGWWTLADFQTKINMLTNTSVGLLELEAGKMFSPSFGLSIRPGFQLWGTAERDFSLQIGSRFFF